MDIYDIVRAQRSPELMNSIGAFTRGLDEAHAREMMMDQMREQRLSAEAQRRMEQIALDDPALVRMRRALEASVEPFQPEQRRPLGPAAVGDLTDLGGAFGKKIPIQMTKDGPVSGGPVEVTMGDITFEPTVEGAFTNTQSAPEKVYETTVRDEKLRKPLKKAEGPRRLTNIPGRFADPRQSERRPDLSPEGADMYAKLAPQLVARRNSEEATRRGLEAEQMRGNSANQRAALSSATQLMKTAMEWAARSEMFKQKRLGAKSRDEQLKWLDQQRDADLQRMKAANAMVQQYEYAMVPQDDPSYRQAVQDAHAAAQAYAQSTAEYQQAMSNKGMRPEVKKPVTGGTRSFVLGPNGQLVAH